MGKLSLSVVLSACLAICPSVHLPRVTPTHPGVSGAVSVIDQSFVAPIKIPSDVCGGGGHKSLFVLDVVACFCGIMSVFFCSLFVLEE